MPGRASEPASSHVCRPRRRYVFGVRRREGGRAARRGEQKQKEGGEGEGGVRGEGGVGGRASLG